MRKKNILDVYNISWAVSLIIWCHPCCYRQLFELVSYSKNMLVIIKRNEKKKLTKAQETSTTTSLGPVFLVVWYLRCLLQVPISSCPSRHCVFRSRRPDKLTLTANRSNFLLISCFSPPLTHHMT
jgi:hypothetical protein